MNAGDETLNAELLDPPLKFVPRKSWLPAQAKIQGQPATEFEVVLDVKTNEGVAIVLDFSSSLSDGWIAGVTYLTR